jgi:nitrate reductase gamma subunit
MKYRSCYFVIFIVVTFLCCQVEASWLIDAEKHHISVHRDLSCGECHQYNDYDNRIHPDPFDVNKTVSDFFTPDLCAECHDSVEDYIAAGNHGGKEVNGVADIENCLDCHNPHYELGDVTAGTDFNAAIPINRQCNACHEEQTQLPAMSDEDNTCMACHRKDMEKASGFCLHCHDKEKNQSLVKQRLPLVDAEVLRKGPHRNISCLICHPDSAQFGHSQQAVTDCLHCHSYHDEKPAHDAHITVSCGACHLRAVTPIRDNGTLRVNYQKNNVASIPGDIHKMTIDSENSCSRCHFSGNSLGAASMVLPAKSLICMPCHTATFSADDTVTMVALALFLSGLILIAFTVMSGGIGEEGHSSKAEKLTALTKKIVSTIFSAKIKIIVKSLLLDALLQRQLMTQSLRRWMIHGLIFYPFVIRFLWGLTGLFLSLWVPDSDLTRMMIDKNHPATALLFDITGIMVLVGVGTSIFAKKKRTAEAFSDMPKYDCLPSLLLGGIVMIGFVLEAVRISMTGTPADACYALIGFGISHLFKGMTGLSDTYAYIWYAHAVLTGIFVAYLPFSRMLHMIVTPVVMVIKRLEKERK